MRSLDNSAATGGSTRGRSVLVAGVGNIFLHDDGFGVEVVRRLALEALPDCVRVIDFGIRGVHLAYEMLDGGYATTIIVDATPRGEKPGTVYLIEPDLKSFASREPVSFDAHAMDPQLVFSTLQSLGGVTGRVLIVGCEPLDCDEGIGLSEAVQCSVDEAVCLVHSVLAEITGEDQVINHGIDR